MILFDESVLFSNVVKTLIEFLHGPLDEFCQLQPVNSFGSRYAHLEKRGVHLEAVERSATGYYPFMEIFTHLCR